MTRTNVDRHLVEKSRLKPDPRHDLRPLPLPHIPPDGGSLHRRRRVVRPRRCQRADHAGRSPLARMARLLVRPRRMVSREQPLASAWSPPPARRLSTSSRLRTAASRRANGSTRTVSAAPASATAAPAGRRRAGPPTDAASTCSPNTSAPPVSKRSSDGLHHHVAARRLARCHQRDDGCEHRRAGPAPSCHRGTDRSAGRRGVGSSRRAVATRARRPHRGRCAARHRRHRRRVASGQRRRRRCVAE